MEGRKGLYRENSALWRSLRDGDYEEEDVWSVLKERTDYSFKARDSKQSSPSSSTSISKQLSSAAARMIPRPGNENYQSSCSYNSNNESILIRQSAPVNIPRWSSIYDHKKSKTPSYRHHELDDDYDDGDESDDGEDDDEYRNRAPPHEVIARRQARSHISSFSVFEGVGRTLKGRDLSKVRHAVLTKTGFLESP